MPFFRKSYEAQSDEQLMRAIATRRDGAALAALYDRYSARMYRYFYRMLWQDAATAEDFTHDLFLKILEKAHLFDSGRNFRTWLYALALNLCKNEYRRKDLRPVDLIEYPINLPVEQLPDTIDGQLLEQQLREAIDQLNEIHKQCFVLRYHEGLSVAEIAEIAGCPEGTVKSRLHMALRKVAGQLEGWGIQ